MSTSIKIAIAAQAVISYPTIITLGLKGIRSMGSGANDRSRTSPWPAVFTLLVTSPLLISDVRAESASSLLVFFSFSWIALALPGIGVWWFRATIREVVANGGQLPLSVHAVVAVLGVVAVGIVVLLTNLIGR